MYRVVLLVFALALVTSCESGPKIGFVDNSELINSYDEKKDVEARLQLKINAYEQRRDSIQKAFQFEVNEAELRAKRMSQREIQELSQEIQQRSQMLAQRDQFEQQQIASESQALNDSLIAKIKQFVGDYAEANGYDYVLGSNEGGSVLYGSPAQDLTQLILAQMNEAYSKSKE